MKVPNIFYIYKILLLTILLSANINVYAQLKAPLNLGDTVYLYNPAVKKWMPFKVTKYSKGRYYGRGTLKDLNSNETIEVNERSAFSYDPDTFTEKPYVTKKELVSYLKFSVLFTMDLVKVNKKKNNNTIDVTKTANNNAYSDTDVSIAWEWGDDRYFGMTIINKNKTQPIEILWNDASYVDMEGNSSNLSHATSLNSITSDKSPTKMLEDSKRMEYVIPNSCLRPNGKSLITYALKLAPFEKEGTNIIRLCIPIKSGKTITRYDFYFKIGSTNKYDQLKAKGEI